MPRQVDAAARRRAVVDALFRVVVRDGLQRASLRAVADEAGLNIGSVRHYFGSQAELMRFAMRSMIDRVTRRLEDRLAGLGDLDALGADERRRVAVELLAELLPLDEGRRAEITVFLDFGVAARTEPGLADLAAEAARGTRALARRALAGLSGAGAVRDGLDLDAETDRLAALVDGLGLHGVLHPDTLSPRRCRAALAAHLEQLAPGGGAGG
ncbi:TetR family transcriptional regulator C-terminal domain-containing protein [Streptomyces sp. ODS28]|uniref:TetR/AcrR family transcriptional regulator n=1 Tax=Streptomyces sp. ODS28 TaxID=3136688 RepID=UPI0031ECBBE3